METDLTEPLCERVRAAAGDGTPLAVTGGRTKDFLGRMTQAEPLDVSGHRGIVTYEPTELVLSARGGTPLAEVKAALEEQGQMLAVRAARVRRNRDHGRHHRGPVSPVRHARTPAPRGTSCSAPGC